MTTHTASCKPELTLLGGYMLQGFVGGILVGMALILWCRIRGVTFDSFFGLAILLVIGGFLGAIKAIPFWAVSCFRRSPLRVVPRIIIGGVVSTSFGIFLLICDGGASNSTLLISSGVIFLYSLPTSLLIGSRVRIEKFFSLFFGGLSLKQPSMIAVTPSIACECDHKCLGSRFAEWQQRAA